MCEIYGISSKNNITINDDLKLFFDHSHKHCHGWGLAILGERYSLVKEGVAAFKSQKLSQMIKRDINAELAMAHIRYATSGIQSSANAHPFKKQDILGNTWTMVHNGTATNGPFVSKYEKYADGETDSESVLLFFISRINEAIILNNMHNLSIKQKGDVLQKALGEISLNNRINVLLSDGNNLFVHSNLKKSLHYYRGQEYVKFSTAPLYDISNWKELNINTLFILNKGTVIYRGIPHSNEYFIEKYEKKAI